MFMFMNIILLNNIHANVVYILHSIQIKSDRIPKVPILT